MVMARKPLFQKKSKTGIATPKSEMDLVRERLARAEHEHDQRKKAGH